MSIFQRASLDLTTGKGRTLEGLAFRWETPSLVQDPGSPRYLEEFARSSTAKTLRERAIFPLYNEHHHDEGMLGGVTFSPASEGLAFRSEVPQTDDGDQLLEEINSGRMRSVSVGFRAFKNAKRADVRGPVTVRQEIGLIELSVCRDGQHDGAEILAVRAKLATPKLDAAKRRAALLVVSY